MRPRLNRPIARRRWRFFTVAASIAAAVIATMAIATPAGADNYVGHRLDATGLHILRGGDYITDPWGHHTALIQQNDGNLVLYIEYRTSVQRVCWASHRTGYNNNVITVMQTDGNLVQYVGSRAIWSSNTVGQLPHSTYFETSWLNGDKVWVGQHALTPAC